LEFFREPRQTGDWKRIPTTRRGRKIRQGRHHRHHAKAHRPG